MRVAEGLKTFGPWYKKCDISLANLIMKRREEKLFNYDAVRRRSSGYKIEGAK